MCIRDRSRTQWSLLPIGLKYLMSLIISVSVSTRSNIWGVFLLNKNEVSPGLPVGLPVYGWQEVRPLFNLKTKQTLQGSLVNSLRSRVDKAGVIIFEWSGFESSCGHIFDIQFFFLFSTSNSNSFYLFYCKRSNSGHKVCLKLSTVSMSMLWQMSLVGQLGSGARLWVRIGLGGKVRVSIIYIRRWRLCMSSMLLGHPER